MRTPIIEVTYEEWKNIIKPFLSSQEYDLTLILEKTWMESSHKCYIVLDYGNYGVVKELLSLSYCNDRFLVYTLEEYIQEVNRLPKALNKEEKSFKEKYLIPGNVILLENGNKYILMEVESILIGVNSSGWIGISSYTNYNNGELSSFNIRKIYKGRIASFATMLEKCEDRGCIWENFPIIELSVSEIERELHIPENTLRIKK